MSQEIENIERARIQKALDELGEYFDTVHIFATCHNTDSEQGTNGLNAGTGNYYARYGQVAQWLEAQQEGTRQKARDSMKEP